MASAKEGLRAIIKRLFPDAVLAWMRALPQREHDEVAKERTQEEAGRVEHAQKECGDARIQRLCGRGGGVPRTHTPMGILPTP